jgi:hypothetical protein
VIEEKSIAKIKKLDFFFQSLMESQISQMAFLLCGKAADGD